MRIGKTMIRRREVKVVIGVVALVLLAVGLLSVLTGRPQAQRLPKTAD